MLWQVKVLTQAALAAMPMGEHLNHQLQRMNAIRRGPRVEASRFHEIRGSMEYLSRFTQLKGAKVVEVGTGWDALPTLFLSQAGASIVTYDHVRHLRHRSLMHSAKFIGLEVDDDPQTALKALRIDYRAPADATATGLPDSSVDVFYSYAVLEHVPPEVIHGLIKEARRVLRPGGLFYGLVGLHDHYNGFDRKVSKVNFLRYPEWLWRPLVKNAISYHNRLRERDFLDILKGYQAEIVDFRGTTDPADRDRLDTMKIAKEFQNYSKDELAVTRTEIIARWA